MCTVNNGEALRDFARAKADHRFGGHIIVCTLNVRRRIRALYHIIVLYTYNIMDYAIMYTYLCKSLFRRRHNNNHGYYFESKSRTVVHDSKAHGYAPVVHTHNIYV